MRDPDDPTRRQRLVRPREEWRVVERPELRIVSDDLWSAVHARIRAPRLTGGSAGPGPRPSTLFGGMLRCGACGGAVTAISARAYGCTARKERGPTVCAGVNVPRRALDARLLSLLRDDLLAPAAIAAIQHEVRAIVGSTVIAKRDERALVEKDAEIARLVDAIAKVGISEALEARLRAAERERDKLRLPRPQKSHRGQPSADSVAIAYRRMILDLRACLEGDVARARVALQKLLGEIRIVAEGDEVYAEVETRTDRVLLEAMGAGVSNFGCGGMLPDPFTGDQATWLVVALVDQHAEISCSQWQPGRLFGFRLA